MRKINYVVAAALLGSVVAFTGCGSSETTTTSGSAVAESTSDAGDDSSASTVDDANVSSESGDESDADKYINDVTTTEKDGGTQYDTGNYSATVPTGWYNVEQDTVFSDGDDTPINYGTLCFIKDGSSADDEATNPTLYINYVEEAFTDDVYSEQLADYDDYTESTMKIGDKDVKCVHISSQPYGDDEGTYEYDIAYIPLGDDSYVCATLSTSITGSDKTASISDDDVMTILESISAD